MRPRSPSDLTSLLLRATGCLAFTLSAMGAGCDPNGGGGTTGPSESSGPAESSSGVGASTNDDTTGIQTTSSATNDTDPGTSAGETSAPDTGSETASDGCIPSGSYAGQLTDRLDSFGHFTFLKLFYAPDAPDQTVDEVFEVVVAPDGTITVELLPRASGSGEGHAGLSGLAGTIGADCAATAEGAIDFSSDTGPFGVIDVTLAGELPAAGVPTLDLTLQGGGIPNGPITYVIELSPN